MSIFLRSRCCCTVPFGDKVTVSVSGVQTNKKYFAYEVGTHFPQGVFQAQFVRYAVVTVLIRAPSIGTEYELTPSSVNVIPGTQNTIGRTFNYSEEEGVSFEARFNTFSSPFFGFGGMIPFAFRMFMQGLMREKIVYGSSAQPVPESDMDDFHTFTQNCNFNTANFLFDMYDDVVVVGQRSPFCRVQSQIDFDALNSCEGDCAASLNRQTVLSGPGFFVGDPNVDIQLPWQFSRTGTYFPPFVGTQLFTDNYATHKSFGDAGVISTNYLYKPLIGGSNLNVSGSVDFQVDQIELTYNDDQTLNFPIS